jgi:hypothetical protein
VPEGRIVLTSKWVRPAGRTSKKGRAVKTLPFIADFKIYIYYFIFISITTLI